MGNKKKNKRQKQEKQRRRREKKKEAHKVGDRILNFYNRICASLIEHSGEDGVKTALGMEEKEEERVWPFLWARMREARIFIVPGDFVVDATVKAGEQIMKALFGTEDFEDYADLMMGEDTRDETNEMIIDLANNVRAPEPEKWPFPSMWIAPSVHVPMTKVLLNTGISRALREQLTVKQGVVLGWLFTKDHMKRPYITQAVLLEATVPGKEELLSTLVWPTVYKPDSGWMHPGDLSPWLCHMLHGFLNSFGTYEEQSPSAVARQDHARVQKGSRAQLPIPKPYYIVKLKKEIIQQRERKAETGQKAWELTFRFDVRGHDRVYIQRGTLPLKPEDRAKLEKRGYRIYGERPVKPYDKRRLAQRDIRLPAQGEWLAMLVKWINNYEKGPEDGPYIPSIRRAM